MNELDMMINELAKRENARTSFKHYAEYVFPQFECSWHHQVIIDNIERMFLPLEDPNHLRRLCVSMPPRHGKSELISRLLPSYILGRNPDTGVMACSYSSELSSRINNDVQKYICSEEFKRLFPDSRLAEGQGGRGAVSERYTRTSDLFEMVGKRGFYRSAGVGGSITGMGGQWLIVDDPIRNRADADSPTIRENILNWYKSTFRTRAEKDARILIVMTRWNPEDLVGAVLQTQLMEKNADQFEYLCLPAIATGENHKDDPRAIGEALWPTKYDAQALEQIKTSLGTREFEALYQQNPTAPGATEWPVDLFADHIWWEDKWPQRSEIVESVIAIDPSKGNEAKLGDYCAITLLARLRDNTVLANPIISRMSAEAIVDTVIEMSQKYNPSMITCESNSFQSLLLNNLSKKSDLLNMRLVTQGVHNVIKKEIRIRRLGPFLEQKRIRVVKNQYGALLVDQLKMFPSARYDDGPDSLELALRTLISLCNGKIKPGAKGLKT
jgi:predicted phage terminase large subunit-like protein